MLPSRLIGILTSSVLLATVGGAGAQDTPPDSKRQPNPPSVTAAGNTTGPRLELSQAEWDFGQLWYGDPCQTEIELKNTGDATLRITEVKSTCGCTVAQPKKKELAPGETVSMTIKYQTTKNAKKVAQYITIITNDQSQPQVRFPVRGEVWHVFDAEPIAASFGRIKLTSRREVTIELRNNLKEKVTPELVPIRPDQRFEAELLEVEPGMHYRLVVRTRPPMKPGSNFTTVTLLTGVERLPRMLLRVSAVSTAHTTAVPDRVWVTPAQTKTGKRTLRLFYPEEQSLEITGLKASDPSIGVRQLAGRLPPSKMSEFAALQIELTLPPYAEIPDAGATVEIATNDPDPKYQRLVVSIVKSKPSAPATGKVSSDPPHQVVPKTQSKTSGDAGKSNSDRKPD